MADDAKDDAKDDAEDDAADDAKRDAKADARGDARADAEKDAGDGGSARSRSRRAARSRNGSGPAKGRADAAAAARAAAQQVLALTGREFEGVVSVERADDGWRIGVELVETRRIPDTADILAVYEVETDDDGELRGLRRVRRYARGQLQQGGR
jgi:hypothetical protein